MNLRCRIVFQAVVCFGLAMTLGCSSELQPLDLAQRIRYAGARETKIVPGTIYVLDDSRIIPVLEFSSILRGGVGEDEWIVHRDAHDKVWRQLAMVRAKDPAVLFSPTIIGLSILGTHSDDLGDPYDYLEIVNRPLSGLDYNRDAEIRVIQWRMSLSSLLIDAAHGSRRGCRVMLCTGVERMTAGELVVEGPLAQEEAGRIAVEVLNGTTAKVGGKPSVTSLPDRLRYSYQIDGDLPIRASFRELSIVGANPVPRVDFTIGAVFTWDISDAPEQRRVRRSP